MHAGEPHVVVVGAGFGGLYAALALKRAAVRVTVIDRRNHHLFLPLLYQVATAGLNPGDIAAPIRHVLRRQRNASVVMAEVTGVDPQRRVVQVEGSRSIGYDYLVLAAGSVTSYFGHDEWSAVSTPMLTLDDALEVRRRVLLSYERAEWEPDEERRRRLLTFVVVGGGPTGVELAGAVAEMARHALARDFRRIDPLSTRVILLEAGDRILSAMPPHLSDKAMGSLAALGVTVCTRAAAEKVDEEGVVAGGRRIPAATVLWAAGVSASPLARSLGAPLHRGRVLVQPGLNLAEHPEIYVIGDMAAVRRGEGLVPWLCPAAKQQGRHAASNIARAVAGRPPRPFRYRDHGTLATIGRSAAVADFGRVTLSGFAAWAAWLTIHIFFLIGFRNRFLVLFQWAWAYLTYERGARLVTGETRARRGADGAP